MRFYVIGRGQGIPASGQNQVFLNIDLWNDFSYVTMFYVRAYDENGRLHDLGNIKIGFKGQTTTVDTHSVLDREFTRLKPEFFSLGTDVKYYTILGRDVSSEFRTNFTNGLRDVVALKEPGEIAAGEEVYRVSLLRDVSISAIEGQLKRVLNGGSTLTDFKFAYLRPDEEKFAGVRLDFEVKALSQPSTNTHAIIGRNGIGKTTLLNGMIDAITRKGASQGRFVTKSLFGDTNLLDSYFSSLVSVSFSAFDPFAPPEDQPNPEQGTCYYYIGLKDPKDRTGTRLCTLDELRAASVSSIVHCLSISGKRERWIAAVKTLGSDQNFSDMNLLGVIDYRGEELNNILHWLVEKMSSGHAIVLLTISKLISKVEEKTLVLLDEPESHLHPPLLSAFTRALNELLVNRNGVAIIATHSPVVIQEIPKSCVWLLERSKASMAARRPSEETFGENVGALTREIFKLEVTKSGYHSILSHEVFNSNKSYAQILGEYGGQLGVEAKAILKSLIIERDRPDVQP